MGHEGWGGSCRGGSCRDGVGYVGVGWVMLGSVGSCRGGVGSHLSDKQLIKLFSEFLCNSLLAYYE